MCGVTSVTRRTRRPKASKRSLIGLVRAYTHLISLVPLLDIPSWYIFLFAGIVGGTLIHLFAVYNGT